MPYTARKKSWVPSKEEEQAILDLAHKIPDIWNAASSTPKEKKRIIRILIEDITVLSEKRQPDFVSAAENVSTYP